LQATAKSADNFVSNHNNFNNKVFSGNLGEKGFLENEDVLSKERKKKEGLSGR